jgi:hypothetical protein
MDFLDLKDYVSMMKDAVDLFKSAYTVLPKGAQRDEIEKRVLAADALLKRSDARLARDLGYVLCKCTFPPTPMLWQEKEQAYICQNQECGHRIEKDRSKESATSEYF